MTNTVKFLIEIQNISANSNKKQKLSREIQ